MAGESARTTCNSDKLCLSFSDVNCCHQDYTPVTSCILCFLRLLHILNKFTSPVPRQICLGTDNGFWHSWHFHQFQLITNNKTLALCYPHNAHSYIQYIDQQMHSIKRNKTQIIKHTSWQISNSYTFCTRLPFSGSLLEQTDASPMCQSKYWSPSPESLLHYHNIVILCLSTFCIIEF